MVRVATVRRAAATLRVSVTTAFRWRHRVLNALRMQPAPRLAGSTVAVAEAYVPFSEKGAGAVGRHGGTLFARKPSCVLLVRSAHQQEAVIASSGRPRVEDLVKTLTPMLQPGAEVWASGLGPYDQACRCMGVKRSQIPEQGGIHQFWAVESFRRTLFVWLARFQGVATRYLDNYLCWLGFRHRTGKLAPAVAAARFLFESRHPALAAA